MLQEDVWTVLVVTWHMKTWYQELAKVKTLSVRSHIMNWILRLTGDRLHER